MRDPERIPLVLAALERRWRESPDLRLGQLLDNLLALNPAHADDLRLTEDARWLELFGTVTDEERDYASREPAERAAGWQAALRPLRQDASGDEHRPGEVN